MPRTQRLPVDLRRARLLELGLHLFGQRAYDDVSTDDIALEGGISKGLLYHYFSNKRGYYIATVHELVRRVVEVTRPDDELPFERAIRGSLERFVAFIRDNGAFYRGLMRGGADDEVQRVLDEARQTMVRRVLDRSGIGELGGAQRVAFFGWSGFIESACLHWLDHEPEVSETELIDMMLGSLLMLVAHAGPRAGVSN